MQAIRDVMNSSHNQEVPPTQIPVLIFATIWHVIVMLGSAYICAQVLALESFLNLGRPVQVFVALLALVPGIVGLISSFFIFQRNNTGRYLGMAMNYVGMALAGAYLLHLWGFYQSFEQAVDTLMVNAPLTLGFVVAYAIFWLAGRFDEDSMISLRMEQIGLGIAGITLILLILATDLVNTGSYILGTYADPLVWGVTIATIIFGYLAFRLLFMGEYFGETPAQRTAWQGWLLLSPNIIGFMIFFAGPLLLSLYLSFTNSAFGQVPEFIGLQNYADLLALEFQTLTDLDAPAQSVLSFGFAVLAEINQGDSVLVIGAKDVLFWISLRNTILFCLMLLPLAIIPALLLSLILNSKLPGVKFFRAIYFLPSVAAVVGTALIWRWLYDPTIGYYNYLLSPLFDFVNNVFNAGWTEPEWLSDPAIVLFSVVLLAAWGVVGYNTVLFLAGLQGIPKSLYEAAMIDGATRVQQFRNVTLPMLAPTTFFVVITTVVTGLQVFNEPYALFPSRPLPENATTAVFYLYTQGFQQTEFGYASAIAWVVFAMIFVITLIQFRFNRGNAYE